MSLTSRTGLAALFVCIAGSASAATLSDAAPGWIATVKGTSVTTPAFPGSESYSFISLPSMNLRTGRAALARDDSTGIWGPGSRGDVGVLGGQGSMRPAASYGPLEASRPTLGPGLFAEYWAEPGKVRLRAEARFDLSGYTGMTGVIGADYVQRVGANAFVSGGPRMNVAGQDYQQAAYGITPVGLGGDALARAYRSEAGVRSVGAGAAFNVGLSQGLSTTVYANYDRMVGQPVDTTTQKQPPSPNQFTFGAQMNYTFQAGR